MKQAAKTTSFKAGWRLVRYLNCAQATFGTAAEALGLEYRSVFAAACPLEGGAVSHGSTCGVVSGGCLALALAWCRGTDRPRSDAGPLYRTMREYTDWFERRYESTLCRERCGVDLTSGKGLARYLLEGRFASRCIAHAGPAAVRVVSLGEKLLEEPGGADGAAAGGYCARGVLEGIRGDTGRGGPLLEEVSVALDGGAGLSGGICGALSGALLAAGSVWGTDPVAAGLYGTVAAAFEGHANMYGKADRPGLWSAGGSLVRGFLREFGSLECASLTGARFEDGRALGEYVAGSPVCAAAVEWCRREASALILSGPGSLPPGGIR